MPQEYTSRLQKVGALIPEMRRLVLEWEGLACNPALAVERNVVGAPSRARVRDIVNRGFVPRYVHSDPPDIWRALLVLERAPWPAEALTPLHYYCCASRERLMWDFVVDWLAPRYSAGLREVQPQDVISFVDAAPTGALPDGPWSLEVAVRVARGLLSSLRDCGVLQGASKKRVAPVYLPIGSFAFIAMARHVAGVQPGELRDDPVWRLFLLSSAGVEGFLVEAQQHGLLVYSAAGSTVRIDFPAATVEEYAHVLAQGTH